MEKWFDILTVRWEVILSEQRLKNHEEFSVFLICKKYDWKPFKKAQLSDDKKMVPFLMYWK